jgi:hypothetical protein
LDTCAVLVSNGSCGFEECFGCPVTREFEVEIEISGSVSGGGGGGSGGGGGGGSGRVVWGLIIRIVVLRRRRGEVFFIHEKVEAFFVLILWVVRVLSRGSRAA